jgi:hypothetical protein
MLLTNRIKLTIGILWLSLLAIVFLAGCSVFKARQTAVDKTGLAGLSSPVQLSAADADAAEPAAASAPDGSFYVAWVNHEVKNQGDVMVASFTDDGVMRSSSVRVNPQAGIATAWRGDPPSLAVGDDGSVYVVWTARVQSDDTVGTDLYLSASNDQGRTFATPVKVNDDTVPGVHGMHSLAVAEDGRIYVSWLDERNIHAPKPSQKGEGHHMESNRDLFLAYSRDGGRTFSANRKVASDVCPCCKTALALASDGGLYLGWRQVLPGDFRHIAVAYSADSGVSFSSPAIVSDDQWVIHGCPVSGPALLVDATGTLKVLWYSAGEAATPGLYFSETRDKGQSFSARRLVTQEGVRGTPVLTARKNVTIAIWDTGGARVAETNVGEIGKAGSTTSFLSSNAELPAAVSCNNRLFVAYINKVNEKRSVWLVRAG